MKRCIQQLIILSFTFSSFNNTYSQNRYWVGKPAYSSNFSTTTELNQWRMVENNGTGSWTLSGNGSCVLRMDNAAGSNAVRIFNETNGVVNRLPLDNVNGVAEFHVVAFTGGNQRFFLQAQEFNSSGNYISEQTLLSAQSTTGHFSVNLSTKNWNAATTQIRFMIGGENYSTQQGTIEINYFRYTHTNRNWSNTANWSASSGGAGGASVPGLGNNAIFDRASNSTSICTVDGNVTIDNLSLNGYSGSLDLNGKNLTITNSATLASATITNSGATNFLTFQCTGNVAFNGATFNIDINGYAANLFFNGSTFNNALNIVKTGGGTDISSGGNIFNEATTISVNNALGVMRMSDVNGDTFNKDATFVSTLGTIEPAYNNNTFFYRNVTVSSITPMIFGNGNGSITLSGTNNQLFSKADIASPQIKRLVMNKSLNNLTLNTDITISTSLTFISGTINTAGVSIVEFANGATYSGASNSSYIETSVKKTGNTAFTFPTGSGGMYRPISISAPALTTDAFTARYFNVPQAFGTAKDITLASTSSCEYWTMTGESSSTVFLTMNWISPDCFTSDVQPPMLRIAHWNGSLWEDYGNSNTTGNASSGTITSSVAARNFSPLIIAATSHVVLPIELVNFGATVSEKNVEFFWTTASEDGNDYFTLERSETGTDFEAIAKVKGAGYSKELKHYKYTDENPKGQLLYYRLKQTDFDGKSKCYKIIPVELQVEKNQFMVYPNPTVNGKLFLNETTDIIVFNCMNEIVLKLSAVDTIDLSGVPKGIYIVKNKNGKLQRVVLN